MTYHVLYNPYAGNNAGKENAQKLAQIFKDEELKFYDITKLNGYASFFSVVQTLRRNMAVLKRKVASTQASSPATHCSGGKPDPGEHESSLLPLRLGWCLYARKGSRLQQKLQRLHLCSKTNGIVRRYDRKTPSTQA